MHDIHWGAEKLLPPETVDAVRRATGLGDGPRYTAKVTAYYRRGSASLQLTGGHVDISAPGYDAVRVQLDLGRESVRPRVAVGG